MPEKGSFPGFLKAAVHFSRFFAARVTLFVSAPFVSDKPRNGGFYGEFLEGQSFQHGIQWDTHVYEDHPAAVAKGLSPFEDFAAVLRENDFSLTETILQNASAPVLVVPASYDQPFRQVLLASVGGRMNDRAMGVTAILGTYGQCKLDVLTIGSAPSPALRIVHEKTKYFFDACKVPATYQMLQGQMEKTILQNCASKRVDLLVLGAQETQHWKDYRFRAFSEGIVEKAACPVLVVK